MEGQVASTARARQLKFQRGRYFFWISYIINIYIYMFIFIYSQGVAIIQ